MKARVTAAQRALLAVSLGVIIHLNASPTVSAAEKPIRFWNLTSATVTELRLAPVGSGKFGADQCKNDKDGSVDHDERLPITGVTPGRYDLKIGYKGGKTCMVANVAIESGKAFSIEDKDLNDCSTGAR
ncbi:MAG: hypothetical protein QOC72_1517 [Methylobacteriaceae bacterium]|nr:hypothetical protein [Methylobacteriaceae bacterium]